MALRIYLAGLTVLIGAILLNVAAKALGLATWYDFLQSAADLGAAQAIRNLRLLDVLFLMLIYPAALGLFAWLILRR